MGVLKKELIQGGEGKTKATVPVFHPPGDTPIGDQNSTYLRIRQEIQASKEGERLSKQFWIFGVEFHE